MTVQLLKVRIWVRVSQKALNTGVEKVRAEIVVPKLLCQNCCAEIVVPKSRGPSGAKRGWYKTLYA